MWFSRNRKRGEDLLRKLCTEQEFKEWKTYGYIWVRGPKSGRWYAVSSDNISVYNIPIKRPTSRAELVNHYMGNRCVVNAFAVRLATGTKRGWAMTAIDLLIAKMLMIKCNEHEFMYLTRDRG